MRVHTGCVCAKTAGGPRKARHVVKLACAERERWWYIRCVQRPFRRRCRRRWEGGTREGSRLGSRGRRRHTMGTALQMHVYYIIIYVVLLVCARHKKGLCGAWSPSVAVAAAAAKYNQTNVKYYMYILDTYFHR